MPRYAQRVSQSRTHVRNLSALNDAASAPQSLRNRSTPPQINITINVATGQMVNNEVEVELKIDAKAMVSDAVLFAVELSYGGMFRLTNIPQEAVQPILMIECPRLIFPYLRRIVGDVTRDGGYPSLNLEQVDFLALYRAELARRQAEAAKTA